MPLQLQATTLTGLAEPLLQSLARREADVEAATELTVVRDGRACFTVHSKDGNVQYILQKKGTYSPFGGQQWFLSNATGYKDTHLHVRRKATSGKTVFCNLLGSTTVATMRHKPGQYYSELQWGSDTYRWELSGPCVPGVLCLINVSTQQCVAQLQCSSSLPWQRSKQRITLPAGQHDSLWLPIVVTSGLAEADRLGVANSWTVPRRWAM